MKIVGIEGMSLDDLKLEIRQGGKFVLYQYCISVVIMTFKRPSNIYFVRANQSRVVKGLPFVLISLLFGWWGIPWGPIYSVQSLATDLSGGEDLTRDVLESFMRPEPVNAGRF
jgi:hypothetical protein